MFPGGNAFVPVVMVKIQAESDEIGKADTNGKDDRFGFLTYAKMTEPRKAEIEQNAGKLLHPLGRSKLQLPGWSDRQRRAFDSFPFSRK